MKYLIFTSTFNKIMMHWLTIPNFKNF